MPDFMHNGHRVFYLSRGEGQLMLLLTGNTSSSVWHEEDIEYFGARFHVAAPDPPGTGRSERLEKWPANWWLDYAHAVGTLIDHLAEGPAILVGTSGGAITALLTAIHYPAKVRAVVADSLCGHWTPEDIEKLIAGRRNLTLGNIAFWQRAHGDDWHDVVEADTAMIAGWRETGIDFFEGRLAEINCPVLFTASLADELVPRVEEEHRHMAGKIPDAQLVLFDDGEHPVMWSRAEDFRRAADSFLKEIST
ncbi:MAG: alpha/beta fold hydrolase [Planctomycetota bacterium]|jgi:pimeloyl-ACP methyl ester carboxylesterase